MQLKSFHVTKFRNIVDSGEITVDDAVTCLVGKNEAGKSGLLEALYLFSPAHGESFEVEEQYPRWLMAPDRKAGDLGEQAPISVILDLEEDDQHAVAAVLGDGVLTNTEITVRRKYNGGTTWNIGWNERTAVADAIGEMPTAVVALLQNVESLETLQQQLSAASESDAETPSADELQTAGTVLTERGLTDKVGVWQRIVNILFPRLPQFFRFTNYSTLPGRIDFADLEAAADDPGRSDLQTARALLSLAGAELDQLSNESYELRRTELEAVQIDLTNQVFEYWKQNPHLEVLIDVDKETVTKANNTTAVARFLDIRLRDRRTGYSNNFSQRSSGFQWFFSFLAAFSEFEGRDSPIVLLDEPALTLHGRAQADFLRFINERLAVSAPVLYTTHSPFMVEADRLERVRIVEDQGPPLGATTTTEVLAADPDSLFPLQAALGYDIAQSLFIGPHNLVVEGTSDFIYLTVMSRLCSANGRSALDERWRILPAGGATNIPTFVSLIGPQLDITVLADSDTKGMQRVTSMVDQELLAGHRLILASVATPSEKADIEDLFSEGDYLKLYNKTYGTSLKVSDLVAGPRIVKRIEATRGEYIHGEVAESLLRGYLDFTFTGTTLARFSALINTINTTIEP